jgi:hypothetical protein
MMSAAALAVAVLAVSTTPALADFSKSVTGSFRGQLVISKDELPTGKNDKDTVAKIKKAQVKEITGSPNADDVQGWTFHYTAFLSKTGAKALKMEFMKAGKLSADKRLDGIDPKSAVLEGDISINEDEGLTKGNTYTIQLLSGTHVVAKTTLIMK